MVQKKASRKNKSSEQSILMSIIKFPFKLVFFYPGKAILLFSYLFPEKGTITKSGRQYKQGGIVLPFIFSCGFWIIVISLGVVFSEGGFQ